MYAVLQRPAMHAHPLLLAMIVTGALAVFSALVLTGGNNELVLAPSDSQTATPAISRLDSTTLPSVSPKPDVVAATAPANDQPLWQTDVMDSHESINSLAALPKAERYPAKATANPAL